MRFRARQRSIRCSFTGTLEASISFTGHSRWREIRFRAWKRLLKVGLMNSPTSRTAEKAKVIVLGFGRAIRRRPITKELMRWELQERNALSDALAMERERQAQHWLGLAPDLHGADLSAVTALLVAGQVFLTLRSKTAETYNGIDLHSDSGWKRIEDAVALLSDLFFQHVVADPVPSKNSNAGQ